MTRPRPGRSPHAASNALRALTRSSIGLPPVSTTPSPSSPASAIVLGRTAPTWIAGFAGGTQPSWTSRRLTWSPDTVIRSPASNACSAVTYSRSRVIGERARAPTWSIQSSTPWPTPTWARPGNIRSSAAISMAASAGLRSGTGSTPMPTCSRSVQASAAVAAGETALLEAVLPQPQLVDACGVGRAGDVLELLGRALGPEDDGETGHGCNVRARPDTENPTTTITNMSASRTTNAVV